MSDNTVIFRDGDTCPSCGAATVAEGLTRAAITGPVYYDGCASCLKIWERETRVNPSLEPCTNCAFLPRSSEMESGAIWQIVNDTVDGPGIFYCHRRVPFGVRDGEKTGFQHTLNANGTRCTNASVCAGWIKAKLMAKHD